MLGSLGMDVAVSTGDGTAVSRSYSAGHDSNVLYAVDSRRGGDGLEVLATARPASPIRDLGTDDFRIYAATDHEVVVLETASFTGFARQQIPVIRSIDYRAGLPDSARTAPLSGMAVGPHRVHLTFAQGAVRGQRRQAACVAVFPRRSTRSVLPLLPSPIGDIDGQHRCVQCDEGAGASERERGRRQFPGADIKAKDHHREQAARKARLIAAQRDCQSFPWLPRQETSGDRPGGADDEVSGQRRLGGQHVGHRSSRGFAGAVIGYIRGRIPG